MGGGDGIGPGEKVGDALGETTGDGDTFGDGDANGELSGEKDGDGETMTTEVAPSLSPPQPFTTATTNGRAISTGTIARRAV